MAEPRKTVFISCGQFTEEEKALGKEVCELVKKVTPFEEYFAENQSTLETLSENILRRLNESVGLIGLVRWSRRLQKLQNQHPAPASHLPYAPSISRALRQLRLY